MPPAGGNNASTLENGRLQSEAEMIKAIREASRTPEQRDTFYEPIKVWDATPTATEAEPPSGKSKVLEGNLATA